MVHEDVVVVVLRVLVVLSVAESVIDTIMVVSVSAVVECSSVVDVVVTVVVSASVILVSLDTTVVTVVMGVTKEDEIVE